MTTTARAGPTDKVPGSEPLPGYRLLEPLGRGGFGEVWKCEAPGGLLKAIKFVPADGEQFRQESAAFERVRAVRHAFLLTLERVELVGGELVMVMELADRQLQDRFRECRARGLPGVPRDELLRYLADAAEALDVIAERHGLQHLDVKPANLFLVDGHVKVGDYGLVRRVGSGRAGGGHGLTVRYASPEVLDNQPGARSDQYSLGLVYYELLAGSFPYPGRTARELMLQHVTAAPDLSLLPAAERTAVRRALAKDPADRFPSCSQFVRALAAAERPPEADTALAPGVPVADRPTSVGLSSTRLPRLVTVRRPALLPAVARSAAPAAIGPVVTAAPPLRLHPVVRVGQLSQLPDGPGDLTADRFVAAVLGAAVPPAPPPPPVGADGPRVCRFLCTLPSPLLPPKLALVAERWGLSLESPEPGRVILQRAALAAPVVRGGSPVVAGGLRVIVRRAAASAELTVTAGLYGAPDETFRWAARQELPRILAAVRAELENVRERRAHPRFPADFPVQVYPVYPDGVLEGPVGGGCEDVSAGGVRFVTPVPVPTDQMYLEFPGLVPVAGQGVLTGLLRLKPQPGKKYVAVGRFRTDPPRR